MVSLGYNSLLNVHVLTILGTKCTSDVWTFSHWTLMNALNVVVDIVIRIDLHVSNVFEATMTCNRSKLAHSWSELVGLNDAWIRLRELLGVIIIDSKWWAFESRWYLGIKFWVYLNWISKVPHSCWRINHITDSVLIVVYLVLTIWHWNFRHFVSHCRLCLRNVYPRWYLGVIICFWGGIGSIIIMYWSFETILVGKLLGKLLCRFQSCSFLEVWCSQLGVSWFFNCIHPISLRLSLLDVTEFKVLRVVLVTSVVSRATRSIDLLQFIIKSPWASFDLWSMMSKWVLLVDVLALLSLHSLSLPYIIIPHLHPTGKLTVYISIIGISMLLSFNRVISKAIILNTLLEIIIISRNWSTLKSVPYTISSVAWWTGLFLKIGVLLHSLNSVPILWYLRQLWHNLTVLTPIHNSIVVDYALVKLLFAAIWRHDALLVSILARASLEVVFVYNSYVVFIKDIDRGSHEWVDFLFKSTLTSLIFDKVFLLVKRRTFSMWSAGDWIWPQFVINIASTVSGASSILLVCYSVPWWA